MSLLQRTLALLIVGLGLVFIAPQFSPYNPEGGDEAAPTRYTAPSASHPMGTDNVARDELSRVLRGSRTSVTIAVGAMLIALLVGTAVGGVSAFVGGWLDDVLMRVTDISLSIPRFLLLLAATSISDDSITIPKIILLIGLTGWFDIARIMRGEVSSLLSRDWVVASRATGVGRLRLALRHIFPQLLPMLIVVTTVGIGHTIVLEAGLSYLGAGVTASSLGSLLQDGSGNIANYWWLTVFPGLAIVLIVLACNALGDALRDVFAPEQVHAWPTT